MDLDPVDKYHHHAEKCFDVLHQHAANPERDTRRLFLWMLFSYWVGNGDLHLKNLALVGSESDGALRLSPAYDLVSTYLYGDEKMALYINGKERDLRRGDFHLLGEAGGLTRTEVDEVMTGMLSAQCVLLEIVGRSLLSEGLKESYRQLLRKRKRALLL